MASLTPRIDGLERNLIINGNFDFWQRGTGTSIAIGSSSTYFGPDRFGAAQSGAFGSMTGQRSTDVPTFAQSGFSSQYSMLLTNGTGAAIGAADYQVLFTRLEGYDYQAIHSRPCRLQFWVKSSLPGTYYVSFRGGSPSRYYIAPYTIAASNTWEKKSIDVVMDTAAGYGFDNTQGINITWALSIGSNNLGTANLWSAGSFQGAAVQSWGATTGATFRLAQVMLIPQDFVTAGASNFDLTFQRAGRTVQQEFAMCRRYCVYWGAPLGGQSWLFSGSAASGTVTAYPVDVQLRGLPTVTISSLSHFNVQGLSGAATPVQVTQVPSAISVGGWDPISGRVIVQSTSTTAIVAGVLGVINTAGFFYLDAEL